MKPYRALRTTLLGMGDICYLSKPSLLHVTSDDPAINVMTDLRRTRTHTTRPQVSLDECNQQMILNNVRLLLVTDDDDAICGIITAADILGEKPMLHMQKMHCSRDEVRVGDIMTPAHRLEVLMLRDVEEARVGDIIETLLKNGRHHAIVVNRNESTKVMEVCGIFSATQIGRQMGVPIEPADIAKTFMELERVIVS